MKTAARTIKIPSTTKKVIFNLQLDEGDSSYKMGVFAHHERIKTIAAIAATIKIAAPICYSPS